MKIKREKALKVGFAKPAKTTVSSFRLFPLPKSGYESTTLISAPQYEIIKVSPTVIQGPNNNSDIKQDSFSNRQNMAG